MKNIQRQSGLTAISIVALLAVAAFFIMLALRLSPIYLENFKVSSHLEGLKTEHDVAKMSEDEILDKLFKRMDIDDVENVKREDVIFEEQDGKLIISIEYEVRSPTVGNIDIVASFIETVEVDR